MKTIMFMIAVCVTRSFVTEGSFYFATHRTYVNSVLNYPSFLAVKMSGSLKTVLQQCRRNCASNATCRTFHVQLMQNKTELGVFRCRHFFTNTCNWTTTLVAGSTPSSVLWDKIPTLGMKPKACVEYCEVKYRGNCQLCRGYSGLKGLDCDIAPKLCSDYASTGWSFFPIWPWGFYGPRLNSYCVEQRTTFLIHYANGNGAATIGYLAPSGWIGYPYTASSAVYRSQFQNINWILLSELVDLAEKKELMVVLAYYNYYRYVFSGFELTPQGDLSLNASLSNSQQFVTPLKRAPFVYNSSCIGFFWQFNPNISICSQQSNFRFASYRLNGVAYPHGHVYLTFN